MALSEGRNARAAAGAANRRRREIHHLVGTLLHRRPGALEVFRLDGSIQHVRIGQRTLFRLAGRTMTRTDRLLPGRSVRVAYVVTESGPLAVMVEVVAVAAGPGTRRPRLPFAAPAYTR